MCVDRNRRCFAAALVASVLGLATPASAQAPLPQPAAADASSDWFPEELDLEVGEQKVLPADDVRSYSEGASGVVEVRLTRDAQRFVLVGARPGTTTLLFLMNDKSERHVRITVRAPADGQRASTDTAAVRVQPRDNIRLDFYFVQLDRGYNHRIGLAFPERVAVGASAAFDLAQGALRGATAVVEDEALLRLDLAQAAGYAKLVRKAAVITQNGAQAQFSGGGEVNIPVQGSLSTGIHSISFGSSIEVLPRYDAESGRLEIELHASVSDLTDDRGSGTPGRTTSELATVVNLRAGQAVLLGGLSAQSEAHSRSGLPLLSQLPLLGIFFGSDRATEQLTENVVFIVPSVVEAVDGVVERNIREALDLYQGYDGDEEDLEAVTTLRAAMPGAVPATASARDQDAPTSPRATPLPHPEPSSAPSSPSGGIQ